MSNIIVNGRTYTHETHKSLNMGMFLIFINAIKCLNWFDAPCRRSEYSLIVQYVKAMYFVCVNF